MQAGAAPVAQLAGRAVEGAGRVNICGVGLLGGRDAREVRPYNSRTRLSFHIIISDDYYLVAILVAAW